MTTRRRRTVTKRRRAAPRRRTPIRRSRGMQRIKTTRWPVNNIGGDRAYCKLHYIGARTVGIATNVVSSVNNVAFTVGAADTTGGTNLNAASIFGQFGSTPNLSTMAALFLKYRIKGIKIKVSYIQTGGDPCILVLNASSDDGILGPTTSGPIPGFPSPVINIIGEQRWGKYRMVNTSPAGRPSTISAYYSANKVFGPDNVVRNDEDFTGDTSPSAPYFSQGTGTTSHPIQGPWLQWGISTLTGNNPGTAVTGVLKYDVVVYTEFYGKRASTE